MELILNPFFWFTLFAVCIKVLCGFRLYRNWNKSPEIIACLGFLLLFYAKSILEIHGYWMRATGGNPLVSMKLYYMFFTSGILLLPMLMHVVITQRVNIVFLTGTIFAVIPVVIYTLSTNYIVMSVEPIQYTFTAVRGEYYFVFQALSISVLLLSAVVPWTLYKKIKNEQLEFINYPNKKHRAFEVRPEGYEAALVRSSNFITGIMPYSIFVVGVISLMAFNIKINIAGVSPLFMSLFIYMLSENIRADKIHDSRRWFFWTNKAKQLKRVTEPFRDLKLENLESNDRELTSEYQKELIDTATRLYPVTQKEQAAYLGMTASKLCRIKQNPD